MDVSVKGGNMEVVKYNIEGPLLMDPNYYPDKRGAFMVPFNRTEVEKYIAKPFVVEQVNQSVSCYGVLRGVHCQVMDEDEERNTVQPKIVRVIQGKIIDLAIDLRPDSPTFGQSVSEELSGENRKMLYIPGGFGHAFLVIEKEGNTIVEYLTSGLYDPSKEMGVDAYSIGFDWSKYINIENINIIRSEKDQKWPALKDLGMKHLKFE